MVQVLALHDTIDSSFFFEIVSMTAIRQFKLTDLLRINNVYVDENRFLNKIIL